MCQQACKTQIPPYGLKQRSHHQFRISDCDLYIGHWVTNKDDAANLPRVSAFFVPVTLTFDLQNGRRPAWIVGQHTHAKFHAPIYFCRWEIHNRTKSKQQNKKENKKTHSKLSIPHTAVWRDKNNIMCNCKVHKKPCGLNATVTSRFSYLCHGLFCILSLVCHSVNTQCFLETKRCRYTSDTSSGAACLKMIFTLSVKSCRYGVRAHAVTKKHWMQLFLSQWYMY